MICYSRGLCYQPCTLSYGKAMLLTLSPSPLAAGTKSAASMHKCMYVRIKKRLQENAAVVQREAYSYKEERGSEGSGVQHNLRCRAKAKHSKGRTQLGVPLHFQLEHNVAIYFKQKTACNQPTTGCNQSFQVA